MKVHTNLSCRCPGLASRFEQYGAEQLIRSSSYVSQHVLQQMGTHLPNSTVRNKKYKITVSGLKELPDHLQLRSNIFLIIMAFGGHHFQALTKTVTAHFDTEIACKHAVAYFHGRSIEDTQTSAFLAEIFDDIDSELEELDELAIGEEHE